MKYEYRVKLENANNILNILLQHNSDIVIFLATDFAITMLNEKGEKFYNWSDKKVLGKNFLQLCKSNNYTCPIPANFFDAPTLLNVNLDSKNSSNKECNINWVISPLTSNNGVIGAIIIGKDVELKKNNIAYYLNGIINSIPGCLYWKNCSGRYLGCNDLTAKLAGLSSPYEVVGKTDWELWGEQAERLIENDEQVITQGKTILVEEELKVADGRWIYFTGIKMPLRDENDNIIGLIGNSLDITELKKTQAELKKSKEQAEAANKVKTEFLENMRHDIRTPLTGIIGFANIIAEESKDPKIKEYVDNLTASSYALNDLLNEILEVIKVSSHEIPLLKKKFDLKQKLSEVIKLNKARALHKHIDLTLDYEHQIPIYMIGDPTRIHRIVLELVANALNFTNKGFVKVSTQLSKRQERDLIVKITVEDTGIGIPKEKQEEIFIQFKRLTPSYEGIYKGAGLGLTIIKQFIDELSGEIYVDDREGGGTCFTLLFPMKEALVQDEQGVEKPPLSTGLPELKEVNIESTSSATADIREGLSPVLLVEDQILAAKVVISLLSHLDCQVDHASNGQEALKFFQEKPYDLILMDIGLPGMDGYEVTRRMRLFELNKDTHIPIIALTAHVDEENKKQCIDAGMNAVLSKPLTKEKARDILNAFIPYRESASSQPIEVKSTPSQDKTLDMNKLNDLFSGKKELINEILNMTIETFPEELSKLSEAYESKDWYALSFVVHKLKGGASYCGAVRLIGLCSQLETAIKSKETDAVDSLYLQVLAEIKAVVKEAKEIIVQSTRS